MNMIQSAKDQVLALTTAAYQMAAAAGLLPEGVTVTPSVEIPKDTANGDYTTTFCLAAAKAMKMNPRQVAQTLIDAMALEDSSYYYEGAKGIKTGNLSKSGRSIITEATQDENTYLELQ